MNNLNSILIEGRLVRDPLLRSTPKGTPFCTFTLASNRFFKQDTGWEKEVSFFSVLSWSRLAETCNSLGRKGCEIRVVGRLKQERWNGPDGKLRSRITIVAEHVEFRPESRKEEEKNSTLAEAAAERPDSSYLDDISELGGGMETNSVFAMAGETEAVTF